jgi:branched-chain amino acid transport system permease protein
MTLRYAFVVVLAATLALAALPWLLSDFLLALAMSCIMYAGLAVSWSMFCGATNYLSLATAAFFGLGAYVTAWGAGALPYGLSVLAGGLVAAGFAALVGAAVLHLRGAYFAVITFGLGELVRHSITYYEKAYEGTVGRIIAEAPESTTVYWTVLMVAAAAVATAFVVRESRLGLALRGIGSDEERAQTLGVNARRSKILAFALSAFFAGALGAAMAVRWTYIDPPTVFNPFIGFQSVLDRDLEHLRQRIKLTIDLSVGGFGRLSSADELANLRRCDVGQHHALEHGCQVLRDAPLEDVQ